MASHHYTAYVKRLSMLLLSCLLLSLVGVRPAAAVPIAAPAIDQAASAPEPEAPAHDHSTHSHASEPAGNPQQIAAQSLAQMSANQTAVPAWHNALSTPEGNAASTDLDPIYPPSSSAPPQVIAGINVSNPVILGDTLYIVQQISDDLHLRAFDLATGAFKWRLPVVGNRMVMTPAYNVYSMWNGLTSSDSTVFTFSLVELNNVPSQATVSAFDPVTHTERWHTQLHPQGEPFGLVYYNNSVYATYKIFNTNRMYLAQIDAATGAVGMLQSPYG